MNNPGYTARAYDAETGLCYFRARMYEGRKGRFLGRDPLRYSRYPLLYSGQYLVKNLDPTGMDEFEVEPSRGRNRRVTLPPWEMDEDQILDWKQKCMQDCADYYFLKFWAGRALDSCMENCERFAATPYIGMRRRMAKRPFEYRIPCGCEAKSDRITGEPPSSPFPGSPHGLGGGYYEILPFPGAGTAVTAGGASPCAIVVVVCDNGVTRMHIGPQNFLDSIGRIRWGKNCRAIVCGGDNSQQSNCLHTDVIDELKDAGITVERVSPSQACGIDSSGNWVENNDIEGME